MASKKHYILTSLTLGIIAASSALLIGASNILTKNKIAENEQNKINSGIAAIFGDSAKNPSVTWAYFFVLSAMTFSSSSRFIFPSRKMKVVSSPSSAIMTNPFTMVSVPTVNSRMVSPESLASMSSS